MKTIWNKWLREILLIYGVLYTIATIISSIKYLSMGILEDPAGNWHEIDRAIILLIIVTAYGLIKNLKIKNFWIKDLVVYIPTMGLTFLYVFLRGFTDELASTAYRDVFINFTVGSVIVSVIAFIVFVVLKRKKKQTDVSL
jgi:hypothetical protein